MEWLAKKNLPFTLHLGDLIDRDFKSFAAVLPLLDGLGHPVLPSDAHRVWNSDAVLSVIDRHPSVAAYCNGHWHSGAEEIRNGVPYITFKSMLHNPGLNAYSAIHLFADRLQIEGNGREVSRVIPLKRMLVSRD